MEDGKPILKLADFGLGKMLEVGTKTSEKVGTLSYTAPEILMSKQYSNKVDVFSLGVLLFCMLTRQMPYDGSSP